MKCLEFNPVHPALYAAPPLKPGTFARPTTVDGLRMDTRSKQDLMIGGSGISTRSIKHGGGRFAGIWGECQDGMISMHSWKMSVNARHPAHASSDTGRRTLSGQIIAIGRSLSFVTLMLKAKERMSSASGGNGTPRRPSLTISKSIMGSALSNTTICSTPKAASAQFVERLTEPLAGWLSIIATIAGKFGGFYVAFATAQSAGFATVSKSLKRRLTTSAVNSSLPQGCN